MESDFCRVAVHLGDGHLDTALPSRVAVAQLLPELLDLLEQNIGGCVPQTPAASLRLCPLGGSALDTSKSLSENGIRDGATLILTDQPPTVRPWPIGDPAKRLAVDYPSATSKWTSKDSRLAASLAAAGAAGLIGYLGVPGPPGAAHLMLGAAAAGTAAMIVGRIDAEHPALFTALGFGCTLVTLSALGATVIGTGGLQLAVLQAVAASGALVWAGRLTLMLCGLSRRVTAGLRADRVIEPIATDPPHILSAVVCAAACCALAAVIGIVATAPGPAELVLAGAVSAVALLAGRTHTDRIRRIAVFGCAGASCIATVSASVRLYPSLTPWLAAGILAVAAGLLWLTHTVTPPVLSPGFSRCFDAAELLVLASLVPLAFWSFGLYRLATDVSGR